MDPHVAFIPGGGKVPVMTTKGGRTGYGQLLLLAALLFGIFTMHTVGHPAAHGETHAAGSEPMARPHGEHPVHAAMGERPSPARHSPGGTAAGAHAPDGTAAGAHAHMATDGGHPRVKTGSPHARVADDELHARVAAAEHTPVRAHHKSPPLGGMDPLSVCLAVLGAFTLVLLLKAGLLRPRPDAGRAPALRRLLDALRPNPPPPRTLLARLSVLRI